MNWARTTGIIIFPLFCLFASLFALLADPNFTPGLLHSIGKEQSVEPTKELFSAFIGLGEIPSLFNAQEASHMEDVAQLFRAGFVLFVVITLIFLYCARKNPGIVRNGFIILAIMLILLAIIPFQTVFTLFHLIFFPQGNWTFDSGSYIIQSYPFIFFFWYALSITAYAFFLGLILFFENILSH